MGKKSRRQQRLNQEEEQEDHEYTTDPEPTASHQSIFSSFMQPTPDDDESEDDAVEEDDDVNQIQTNASTKKKRKTKKKKKLSSKIAQANDAPTTCASINRSDSQPKTQSKVDEIDQALIELAEKLPNLMTEKEFSESKRSTDEIDLIVNNLLKVDTRNLDSELELRKMFGARVVSSTTLNDTPMNQIYGSRISNNPHHQLNTKTKIKSTLLTKPHPLWPELDKLSIGLSVRKLSHDEVKSAMLTKSDEWFKFEHSVTFRFHQSRFLAAVSSLDPNQLVQVLQKAPYHPDTLLQLSEVSAQNEDHLQSLNFVNQALYVNEKVLNFKSASTTESSNNNSKSMVLGNFRLDYNSIENRNFFRSLNYKLKFLIKQGCYKTAFETCKLLFSLNPYQDPYGSLLWIDFLAVKSNQHAFFLDFFNHLQHLQLRDPNGGICIGVYPGLHLTKALCMRAMEEKNNASHEESDSALESAILRFPQLLKPLAQMIGIVLPPKLEQSKLLNLPSTLPENSPQTSAGFVDPDNMIKLLSQIYVNRSSSLWKLSNHSNWLQSTILRCKDKFDDLKFTDTRFGLTLATNPELYRGSYESIYRSVLVSADVDALRKFLPPWVYTVSNAMSFSFDPLPPSRGDTYDENYFSALRRSDRTTATLGEAESLDSEMEEDGMMVRGERDGNVEEDEQEAEDHGLIFSDQFDPSHLSQETVNRLISRIQSNLQINYDQFSLQQLQDLLSRLDALFDRQREFEHHREPNPPIPETDSTTSEQESGPSQIGPQEPSFDHSHQMPGSFFNAAPS